MAIVTSGAPSRSSTTAAAASSPLARLRGKTIVILGLGREGLSTYEFLRSQLPEAPVVLCDQAADLQASPELAAAIESDPNVALRLGDRYLDSLAGAPVIFKSPGIRPSLPEIIAAQDRGALLTSNTELFFELCPGKIVGITGTKGKSTTASLIHAVLRSSGGDFRLLGNIGFPPLSGLEGAGPDTLFVLELSSYQLASLKRSPHVAVLQQIVPEHLDYHGSFEEYVKAKLNITAHQSEEDTLVYNAGYPLPREIARSSRARKLPFGLEPSPDTVCFEEEGWLVLRTGGKTVRVIRTADVPLVGRFNLQNVMPAVIVGDLSGMLPESIAQAVRAFRPLEHRVEPVAAINGVAYYNDSISTVPEAAIAALETFAGRPLVLLAGGHDRGVGYGGLARALLAGTMRAVILFPPTGDRIAAELDRIGGDRQPARFRAETMSEAVELAFQAAKPGDVVLLSPASASYGQYRDYRDRGEQFKAEVRKRQETSR